MRKRFSIALLGILLPLFTLAYTSPGKPSGFVNDFAQIISPEVEIELNRDLDSFEKSTGAEISVVTIPTYGRDETIETYAVKLFEEWGIGKEKEDNGLLLLVSRDDREVRIEVGYGLEPVITDIQSGRIIQDILAPAFQAGNYDEGISRAVNALMQSISTGEAALTSSRAQKMGFQADWIPFILFLMMFITSILARSKSWWLGGLIGFILAILFFANVLVIAGITLLGFLFDYIVSKTYKKSKDNGIDPPWWIGGGHHGGRGGGFGGFGGGMSGGGGASGRW